jgi:hypothetical protein
VPVHCDYPGIGDDYSHAPQFIAAGVQPTLVERGARLPRRSMRLLRTWASSRAQSMRDIQIEKRGLCLAIAVTVIALAWVAPTFAHHSFAMFDQSKQVTLKGTVSEFQWTNPHAWIHIAVPNADGLEDTWQVELNSPNNLKRQGWKSSSIKPGDQVTLMLNPLKDGSKAIRWDTGRQTR